MKIQRAWLRTQFTDYDSLFEREFDREMLKSERRRSLIVLIISIFLIIWFPAVQRISPALFPEAFLKSYNGLTLFSWFTIIFSSVSLYEFFFMMVLWRFIRKDRMFPLFPRYANAFIEASVPTAIIYFVYATVNNELALYAPMAFLYFVFISLSAMRLMFSLSLFTGIAAGLEFIILAYYITENTPRILHSSDLSMGTHIAKGLLMMLVGLTTGLVSLQIKRRISNSIHTIEEKNSIISIFGQHVSPEVVNKLLTQKGDLGSETRYVCTMFLDIRNFTKFSEDKKPEEVVNFLNYMFDFMIDIINEHRGIINKFLGDGFMAVFGAPFSDGQDSRNAVNAAQGILSRLQREIESGNIPATGIGIGIHAGEAVTGNVGSSLRKEYTIIGDVVNLASRIEQLNKKFKSTLLVSSEVWKTIKDLKIKAEDMGPVSIRGRDNPIRIYRLA